MKQTVGHTFIFKLVLVFTLLFTCFLALAITYNKVFKLKNEITSIIEKYEGINEQSLTVINNYLSSSGYNTKGRCPAGNPVSYSGVKDYNTTSYDKNVTSGKYYYCFLENRNAMSDNESKKYYNVVLFYKFNLPIIGDVMTYKIEGETKAIYN